MYSTSTERRRSSVVDGKLIPPASTYTPYRAPVARTPLVRAKYIPNVLKKRVKINSFHPPLPNTLRIGQPMNPAHVAGSEGRNGSLERLNSYQPPQISRRGLEPHSPRPYTACPPLTSHPAVEFPATAARSPRPYTTCPPLSSHPAVEFPANVAQSLPVLILTPPESSDPAPCDHSSGNPLLTVDHAWEVEYQKCNHSLRRSKNRISRLTEDLSRATDDLCRAEEAQEKSELDAQLARCEVAILHEAVESIHQQDQLDIDCLRTDLAQSKRESKHLSLKICELEAAIQLLQSSRLSGTTLEVDELDLSSLEILQPTVFRSSQPSVRSTSSLTLSEPLKDELNRMPSTLKVRRKPDFIIRPGHESPFFLETVAGPSERPDPSATPPQSEVVGPFSPFRRPSLTVSVPFSSSADEDEAFPMSPIQGMFRVSIDGDDVGFDEELSTCEPPLVCGLFGRVPSNPEQPSVSSELLPELDDWFWVSHEDLSLRDPRRNNHRAA